MVVMAAIVAGAIRSFFLQPFKIPTNSMWPTYNGMTAEVRAPSDPVPSLAQQALDKVQWTWTYAIPAEATGEIGIPLGNLYPVGRSRTYVLYGGTPDKDRGILGTGLFPSNVEKHTLIIGGINQTITVPASFNFHAVLLRTFFPEESKEQLKRQDGDRWEKVIDNARLAGRIKDGPYGSVLMTGMRATAGQVFLNFDIRTGDMLFVDRMSYHFVDPSRGDTFVFRTNNIPGLFKDGRPSQDYYVKRLAGGPGQKLRVGDNGELFVDGKVVTSPEPMVLNSPRAMDQGYYGYLPEYGGEEEFRIHLYKDHTVKQGYYFAMGDNSAGSYDSRGWGEVPAKDVVGKPLFILHPFTSHWGPAK
jgi:signal peptidase I